jgi:hypothetical protein
LPDILINGELHYAGLQYQLRGDIDQQYSISRSIKEQEIQDLQETNGQQRHSIKAGVED